MTFRKSILLLVGLSMIAALVACSSSSHNNTPPATTVTLSSVSSPLIVNSQTGVTATTNDTAGVNWTVACTTAPCGTISPTTSLTGVATTYTAPAFPTTGVVITATSVTTPTVFAATSAITIGAASLAAGTYVFKVSGWDVLSGSVYHLGGAFTVGSNGAITGGEQDFVDFNDQLGDLINSTGSSATTSSDGNLQITLATCLGSDCTQSDTLIGPDGNGIETLSGSVYPLNTAKAAITEFDASATGSGELDLQDTTAFTVGTAPGPVSYAFAVGGWDSFEEGGSFFAMGGIINVDGAAGTGTISGTGSVFDANDAFETGLYSGQDFANTSIVSAPDQFGRVTFTLDTGDFSEMILAGYIVNGNKTQLVETVDAYEGNLAGVAYTQASTGGFTNASIAGNTYVLGMHGDDNSFLLQAVSQLTLAASGNTVSGFVDYNDLVDSSAVDNVSPDPVTAAAYAVDAAGAGDVTITDITDGVSESGLGVGYNLQLYLDGNGHALAITLDATDILSGAGYLQSGTGSFTAASFSGSYAMGATGANPQGPLDAVGPVATGTTSGTFAGFSDVNWLDYSDVPVEASNNAIAGTFTSNADGIFTGSITGMDVTTCTAFGGAGPCSTDAFNFYLTDATGDNIAIETDLNQLTLGYFIQQ